MVPVGEVARANAVLLEACRQEGVWPYFVPKGFIITPVLDVGAAELAEALRRLLQAISVTAVTISLTRCSSGGTRANSIPGGTAAAAVCSAVATGKAMVKVASVCTNCLLLPSSYEQRPSSSSSSSSLLPSPSSGCVCNLVESASKDSLVFVEPSSPPAATDTTTTAGSASAAGVRGACTVQPSSTTQLDVTAAGATKSAAMAPIFDLGIAASADTAAVGPQQQQQQQQQQQ